MSLYRGLVGRLARVHRCALIFVTLAGVASASVSGRATYTSIPSTRRGLDYSQATQKPIRNAAGVAGRHRDGEGSRRNGHR